MHFTRALLAQLAELGIPQAFVTLHIGWGTFKPIRTELRRHRMLPESFEVKESVARDLVRARSEDRRIVAVGTSVVRTLESSLGSDGRACPGRGRTELVIHPPRSVRSVDALVTNFHLPR